MLINTYRQQKQRGEDVWTAIRVETQEERRKERRWMDGGDEYEKERKRVREGPVTASHFLDLISFRPHNRKAAVNEQIIDKQVFLFNAEKHEGKQWER